MLFPCLSTQKIAMNRKMSVDSGASCGGGSSSTPGSSASLNVFSTPKLQPASGTLISFQSEAQASSGKGSPGSSDSGLNETETLLDQGLKNIHITENPISETAEELEVDAQNNPKC